MAENEEPVKVEEQGPFIHQLQLFLVGGQHSPSMNFLIPSRCRRM